MPLTADRYRVLMTDDTEHEVTVLHGDRLRAELEGPRQGLPPMQSAPMHYVTLWLWASLTRTKTIEEPFQGFAEKVVTFEEIEDIDQGDAPETAADPTPAGRPTGSRSTSDTTSRASTGSPLSTVS